jgi:response regulator RpfG family c-di-GMP phosphodiesterase
MPIMLGTELLTAIKSNFEDNVRVILTGHIDMNDLITCINNGLLYRYLVKPWRREELLSVVEEGMKKIKIECTIHRLGPE